MSPLDPTLRDATGRRPLKNCPIRPVASEQSSNQFAIFPKNEHWRRCTIEESIPCDTMMPVPNSFIYGSLWECLRSCWQGARGCRSRLIRQSVHHGLQPTEKSSPRNSSKRITVPCSYGFCVCLMCSGGVL